MVHRKSWGRIVAIVILGLAVMCAPASSQQFSTPKNVSNNSDFSFTPQLAVDLGGNIYVVWEDDTASNSNILFSRSTDGGATFFPTPMKLSNSLGCSFNPNMAVDASANINVVWQDSPDCRFRTSNIFFSRSTDGGITFSPPMNLSQTIISAFYSIPRIAVHTAGNISVVWESDTGNLAIWFSGSSDGGATFSAPTMLSTNTGGSIDPQIAVDKVGNINVVWEDELAGHSDISFSRSADNGTTFSPPMNLSNPLGNSLANSNSPRLALDLLGNINAVWANDSPGNFDIFISRSTDGGVNFSGPKNISKSSTFSSNPFIAVDAGGNINVVWADIEPADFNTDIFFARSSDGGATFSTAQNVSRSSGFSSNPWLTVDAGANINVSWEDNTPGNRDIFFARSTDSGTTFPTPVNLSADSGLSLAAQIATDKNGNINVAWQDHTPGVSQIFFSRFSSGAAANHPPVAVAGPDQTVPSTGNGGTSVQLDGSSSSDPDGDVLSFVWMDEANNVVGTTAVVPLTLSLGTHTFTLTVTDPGGLSSTGTTHVTVAAVNHPPVANAGVDQTVPSTGNGGTLVQLDGSKSSDPDSDVLSFVWMDETNNVVGTTAVVPLTLSLGTHTFTLKVTDPGGLSSTATTHVTVAAVNHPPVANAGVDQTVQSTGTGGTFAQLDGSKSSDPDGDVLGFVWKDEANNVVGTTAVVPLTLSLGTHTFTLKVTDPGGLSSTATTHVTVAAVNHPPVADAVAVQTLECAGPGSTRVILNGSKSSDPDGDVLSFVWKDEANSVVGTTAVVPLTLSLGTHTFTLTVTDPGGLHATATTLVTVRDTATPTLRVMLSPDTLWSPNHKLVQITATLETSDGCDANPAVTLESITSNEPDNGLGDGDEPNDIQAVGGGPIPFGTYVQSFLLRAERSGMGAGRVYTVNYMVRDASGNKSLASAQVYVGSQTTVASPNRSGRKK